MFPTAILLIAFILFGFGVYFLVRPGSGDPDAPAATIADVKDWKDTGAALFRVPFDRLSGWRQHDPSGAMGAFLLTCRSIEARDAGAAFNPRGRTTAMNIGEKTTVGVLSGKVGDWQTACAAALALFKTTADGNPIDPQTARDFFTTHFEPVLITTRQHASGVDESRDVDPTLFRENPIGKATGYYEPSFKASTSRTDQFSSPVYARPTDLVGINLAAFSSSLPSRRLFGRLIETKGRPELTPYDTREKINDDGLVGRATILGWMEPTDLFFLQIQGSGRLIFETENGVEEVRVGYDGANGRAYYAIGRTLIENGDIAREDMSMQAIRNWLDEATPDMGRQLREENASYVFFRTLDDLPDKDLGPFGAAGVQLTTMRSVAIDPSVHGYGTPIWLIDRGNDQSLIGERLYVAQDTGGAIRGASRVDVYIGSGKDAGDIAGGLNTELIVVALWPKSLAAGLPEIQTIPVEPFSVETIGASLD